VAERTPPIPAYATRPRPTTTGRWGFVSVVAALLATAFIPAAVMGGGDWGLVIENVAPLWCILCLLGLGAGIRGMQIGKRATFRQRTIAATGAFLSLLTFIALTLVAIIGGQ
jgi:hypothetical protein